MLTIATSPVAGSKCYKTWDAQHPWFKHSFTSCLEAFLVQLVNRHGCPVPPFTSPSHHDPRLTLQDERLSGCLQSSCIGLQSASVTFCPIIRAYLCNNGFWESELYLQLSRELYVSSTGPYLGRQLRGLNSVVLLALLVNCSTSLVSLASPSSRIFRRMLSIFGLAAQAPTRWNRIWRNCSNNSGISP